MGFFPYEGQGQRPRKAQKETISYLTQIEDLLNEQEARESQTLEEGGAPGEEEGEEAVDILANVLEEIKFEVGSLCMDRRGSTTIERLVPKATAFQLRVLLHRMRVGGATEHDDDGNEIPRPEGYTPALFTNRYSSHVLQKIFSLAGEVVQAEELGDVAEANEEDQSEKIAIPTMTSIILAMCKELKGNWVNIGQDISGSFVCRALACVLAGVTVVQEKRGKNAKHRGGDNTPQQLVSEENGGFQRFEDAYRVPTRFHVELTNAIEEVAASEPHVLQALCCDTFACPLLTLLLRLDAHCQTLEEPNSKNILEAPEDSPGSKLANQALEWRNRERSQAIVYGMSGERVGSHFLEAVVRLAPPDLLGDIGDRCMSEGQVLEYAHDQVANYLVQTMLQRVPKAQAKIMIRELCEGGEAEASGGLCKLIKAGKGGVVWRVVGACARHSILQKKTLRALNKMAQENSGTKGKLVLELLQPRLPEDSEKGKLQINVPGAKIVQQLLRYEPQHAKLIAEEIICFHTDLLAACAKDNVASRCLIDPLFDSTEGDNEKIQDLQHKLIEQLKGHYGILAADRVGHHCILKLYSAGNLEMKQDILQELIESKSRLQATSFGRKLLTFCGAESFEHRPVEWRRRLQWGDTKKDFLNEVLAVEKEVGSHKDGDLGEKRKRKRNRNRKRKQKDTEENKDKTIEAEANDLLGFLENESSFDLQKKEKTDVGPSNTENKDENVDLSFIMDAIKDSTTPHNFGSTKQHKRKKKKESKGDLGLGDKKQEMKNKSVSSFSKTKKEKLKPQAVNKYGQNVSVLAFAKDMSHDVSKTDIHEMVSILDSERTLNPPKKKKKLKKVSKTPA